MYESFTIGIDPSLSKKTTMSPPTDIERTDLVLARAKCEVSWNLLDHLYQLQRTTSDVIPGIPLGFDDPIEVGFSLSERQLVDSLIKKELSSYYDRIWRSPSMHELRELTTEIILRQKRVPTRI